MGNTCSSHPSRPQTVPHTPIKHRFVFTNRPIPPNENSLCPITEDLIPYEERCITENTIEINEAYAKCETCNTNFTFAAFFIWLENHDECPMLVCDSSSGKFKYYYNSHTPNM